MFRIILSLQLTVFVLTSLSVEEPQSVENFQFYEDTLPDEDVNSRAELTAKKFESPLNAQFVPIPVVPLPAHLMKPTKRPGKVSVPPPPPKRKPQKPTKRPRPVRPVTAIPTTTVSEIESIKPLPDRPTTAAPFEVTRVPITTRLPFTPVDLLSTANTLRPAKRPGRTTPTPGRPTSIRPVTTRPTTTKEYLTEPPRRPAYTTTTIQPDGPVPLVHSTHVLEDDGSYFFEFLAANSVQRAEKGFFKIVDGEEFPVHVKIGNYSFNSPEGVKFKVEYIADENGYRISPDT